MCVVGRGGEGSDVDLGTDLVLDLGHSLLALVFLFENQGVARCLFLCRAAALVSAEITLDLLTPRTGAASRGRAFAWLPSGPGVPAGPASSPWAWDPGPPG